MKSAETMGRKTVINVEGGVAAVIFFIWTLLIFVYHFPIFYLFHSFADNFKQMTFNIKKQISWKSPTRAIDI